MLTPNKSSRLRKKIFPIPLAPDAKPEDQVKLDEELKANLQEEKLAAEQKFRRRTAPQDRAALLPDEPTEPKPVPPVNRRESRAGV